MKQPELTLPATTGRDLLALPSTHPGGDDDSGRVLGSQISDASQKRPLGEPSMVHIPISRWGEPYKSMVADQVVHFVTGEVLAEVSRCNGGLVERDMRHAPRARAALRDIPIRDLLQMGDDEIKSLEEQGVI